VMHVGAIYLMRDRPEETVSISIHAMNDQSLCSEGVFVFHVDL
jgi:hypothetical protein